jgi:hypothetical protein
VLGLPWLVAPRDLAAGEHITLGREVADGTARPPMIRDVTLTVGEDVPVGTILGVDPADGRLHPLPAKPDPTDKPGRRTTRVDAATARRAASVSRPARRAGN